MSIELDIILTRIDDFIVQLEELKAEIETMQDIDFDYDELLEETD